MPRIILFCFTCLLVLSVFSFSGCMSSAEDELKIAEEKLDEALDMGAYETAPKDYRAAQEYFEQAMELMNNDKPSDARSMAKKSQLRSEDALQKIQKHQNMLEAEEDRLER